MRGDARREVEIPLFAVRLLRLEEDAPLFSVPLAFIAFYVYGMCRHLAIVYGKLRRGPLRQYTELSVYRQGLYEDHEEGTSDGDE